MASHSALLTRQEIQFEENIQRNPYSVKIWFSYLDHTKASSNSSRCMIYERALFFLPRSYKLWHAYLQEQVHNLKYRSVSDNSQVVLINTFERSLVQLHTMPRIWYVVTHKQCSIYMFVF